MRLQKKIQDTRASTKLGLLLGLIIPILVVTGCAHLGKWNSGPARAQVNSELFFTNAAGATVTVGVLQLKVMRFADEYVASVAQASDILVRVAQTPESRLAGMRWKLSQATAAYTDASGINPVVNALDLLVLVTISRMVIEDYGVEKYGTNVLPLLQVHRQMEARAWDMVNGTLTTSQKTELQNLIQEWRRQNPHQRYVGEVRFIEFASALGKKPQASTTSPNSIFSLLFIDPFAGLDPTTAAIEEAQQFCERMMYYGQRMPTLLGWQAEVVTYEIANQPESRQILTNAQQLASAADVFAKTASQLPQVINDQRQAAIDQVFNRLMTQETNARALLLESRGVLDAGSETAKSIDAAVKSLDAFVRYVSPPSTNTAAAISTNEHPFNVLDYGTAASQIGVAAAQLNAALQTLNQTTPELVRLSQQASERADRLVMRAFWLALVLIGMFLAGLALVGRFWRTSAGRTNLPRDTDEPSR